MAGKSSPTYSRVIAESVEAMKFPAWPRLFRSASWKTITVRVVRVSSTGAPLFGRRTLAASYVCRIDRRNIKNAITNRNSPNQYFPSSTVMVFPILDEPPQST